MFKLLILIGSFFIFYTIGFAQKPDKVNIIQKPIVFDSLRKALSIEYLKTRHGIVRNKPEIDPIMIVLHYTAGGDLNTNFAYFNKVELEKERTINYNASRLNVSAHFIVDRDGKIYQLMNETSFARHTIGLNHCAIGIENIGGPKYPLTKEQLKSNIQLVKHLYSKFKIRYLIGHGEYLRFRNSDIWKETSSKYITQKTDPGDEFMKEVRKGILPLKLKSDP